MSEEELKDLYIETENFLFGRVTFLYMKIPFEWRVIPIPRYVDVEAWIESSDTKWVVSGFIGVIFVDDETDFRQTLYINVKRNLSRKSLIEILDNESKKTGVSRYNLLSRPEAGYIIFKKKYRKFLVFGDSKEETMLRYVINCKNTRRILLIDLPIKDNPYKIIDVLNPYIETIRC